MLKMFGARSALTVSKLKSLSNFLGCSFSSLRCSLKSTVRQDLLNLKNNTLYHTIIPLKVTRSFSTTVPKCESDGEIDMLAITDGDEALLKKLKVLLLEVEVMRQDGQKVPSSISNEKWKELLTKPTRSQRIKTLSFWFTNEKRRELDKKKKKEKKRMNEIVDVEEKNNTGHIYYGLGGSSIFLRIYDAAIDHQLNCNLIKAMMFEQKIIVDCSYDSYMNDKEASLCAKQLCFMFAENRSNKNPFNLYFCNADKKSKVIQKLGKLIPTLYNDTFPLNITENSYLDFLPKEKLVYLTPHCKQNLKTYNHDDIYIIGAMVDRVNNEPLSLSKAKSQGLRMAKLPLDHYLHWGIGTKSLTLNQVLAIMLEMKNSGDWNKALQHVPRRKLKQNEEEPGVKNHFYHLKKRKLL